MEENRFKETLLSRKEFIYTLEFAPGRGSRWETQDEMIRIAGKAAKVNSSIPQHSCWGLLRVNPERRFDPNRGPSYN